MDKTELGHASLYVERVPPSDDPEVTLYSSKSAASSTSIS